VPPKPNTITLRAMTDPQRQFIRHTVNVPLQVKLLPDAAPEPNEGVNVSHGGLAFTVKECLPLDQVIELRIPTVDPPFEAHARVAWCKPEGNNYLVGVQFLDSTDAFQSRMVQQVCAIEQYRQEVAAKEGRKLSSQEAASEWIRKYAGRFPDDSAA
jgi:hypothetical protein